MILRFLLLFFIVSACALTPGFKKEPSSKNPKRLGLEQNGVTLFFHNISSYFCTANRVGLVTVFKANSIALCINVEHGFCIIRVITFAV